MHDVLYHASLYIGEGGTMATEAALLGTPSIFLSSLAHSCGVFEEEARADLLVLSTRQADALARARTLLEDPEGSKRLWKGRRDALLATKVDVVDMAVRALEMHARTG
jgi:predicted glycosyltransferase